MQFIDCVVGIIEGGGIDICKMYFKKSILDLFKFKKKENQDPQEDNHLGDIDVLCHLIENFEKVNKKLLNLDSENISYGRAKNLQNFAVCSGD